MSSNTANKVTYVQFLIQWFNGEVFDVIRGPLPNIPLIDPADVGRESLIGKTRIGQGDNPYRFKGVYAIIP
ncbi:MAG: hypothetical protein ACFFDT_07750 [Candidatus Hodarchaeota archaeon]